MVQISATTSHGIFISPIFLRKSYGSKWKSQAEMKIASAECVIVYDSTACAESINTEWEVAKALEIGKTVITLSREDIDTRNIGPLRAVYDLSEEFEGCFGDKVSPEATLDIYKIMVESSEQLIQRRQITNGFFITVISAVIAAIGFVIKEGIIIDSTAPVLLLPIIIGLLLCRSWGNLIKNYGRLNAGKFKVIHRLERDLNARAFEAEWVALGKGLRKEKYQSFTATEQNVPSLFSYLLWALLVLTIFLTNWGPTVERAGSLWLAGKSAFLTDEGIEQHAPEGSQADPED
jgi:hypothetical protein